MLNKMDRSTIEKLLEKEDLTHFAKSVDRLRFITRYATAPRSSKESVAEHSFFVAAYVLKLAQYYQFDVTEALALALMHDYPEAYISDVPHPIKVQNPDLANALEKAEEKVLKDHLSDEMASILNRFNNADGPEALVCILADVMSVVSYAKYEMELGNSSYMRQVYEGARPRFENLITSLAKYALGDQTETSFYVLKQIEDIFESRIENN